MLTDISGLSNVNAVEKDLTIRKNEALCQDHAQSIADELSVGGSVDISENNTCE